MANASGRRPRGELGVESDTSMLWRLLRSNPEIDWRAADLGSEELRCRVAPDPVTAADVLALLAAYQRLLRILPSGEEERALPLIQSGIHSAIQIASIPQRQFERRWDAIFPGETEIGLAVYRAARRRRSVLLHHRMNELQENEPHYRASRFK